MLYVEFGGGKGNEDGIGWMEILGDDLLPHL